MSYDELTEAKELAEKIEKDSGLLPATFVMSILAVVLAAVSILSHRTHTQAIIKQTEATDQWALYQSRNLRRHNYELFSELMQVSDFKNKELATQLQEKYKKQAERYDKEKEEPQKEAEKLQNEVKLHELRADRFDLAEGLIEIALVITSITLMTRRKPFLYVGVLSGVVGVVITINGLLLH